MYKIKIPKFGLTMETGTIENWFKEENEKVEKGESLLEISTDKILNEVESPVDGILAKIIAQAGEEHPVGTLIGIIIEEGEKLGDFDIDSDDKEDSNTKVEEAKIEKLTKVIAQKAKDDNNRVKISPIAKKLAKEYKININDIKGTGPDGRIIKKNIEDIINSGSLEKSSSVEYEIKSLSTLRKKILDNMLKSYHSTVTITNSLEVDFTNFKIKTKKNNISITSGLCLVLCKILKEFTNFNAHFVNGELRLFNNINIGIAVDTPEGLIVPVIKNANLMSGEGINSKIKELAVKARDRKLNNEEISNSSFTISNLGMLKTDVFTPVLNPPEVAILGVGRIVKKPVVIDNDKITIRDMGFLSLSYDHRIIDGADAARFLGKLSELISDYDI